MQPACQTTFLRRGDLAVGLLLTALSFLSFYGCSPQEGVVDIHVLVAASAKEATERATETFLVRLRESDRPRVVIASGSSSSLAQQILAGAPADLFVSANPEWTELVADGAICSSLLSNRLVLATPKSNPRNVTSVDELAEERVETIAIAGKSTPIGRYANQAIRELFTEELESITPKLVYAKDSSAIVTWLERGEVDVAFVYASDLERSTGLHLVQQIDESLHDPIVYSIVTLADIHSPQGKFCDQFQAWLRSEQGQAVYRKFGFESPY